MEYICKSDGISIRKMRDCDEDYTTVLKWLSDPNVLEYYEGRNNPFDMDKVKEKFAHRARGESRVVPCIIEYIGDAIGFIQFYKILPDEYCENEFIEMRDFILPYGMDIVIGETNSWNKGLGTKILKMLIQYLFETLKADILFVDPQTWNKRAIRCYEKCGFRSVKVIKERELHDGEYKDSLIMCQTANNKSIRTK